jgi:hypothetical protein
MNRILILVLATCASVGTAHAFDPQPEPPREAKQLATQPEATAKHKPAEKPTSDGKTMQDYIVQRLD